MSLKVTGEINKIFDTESKTDTFQAREFILEVPGNYPQLVKFQLVQDRCGIIDNYSEGNTITVHFDLRGRKWTNPDGEVKYFTSLNAWRIEGQEIKHQPAPAREPEPASQEQDSPGGSEDDLPF